MNDGEVDLRGVTGDADSAARGIEFGTQLMLFAEAVVMGDEVQLRRARETLLQCAGPSVLVDAAGVAANFQRMVRIADAIGIPVDTLESDLSREVRGTLDLDGFESARQALGGRLTRDDES